MVHTNEYYRDWRKKQKDNPKYIARVREEKRRQYQKIKSNPERFAKLQASKRDWARNKRATDPEFRKKECEIQKKYASKPENKEEIKTRTRLHRQKNHSRIQKHFHEWYMNNRDELIAKDRLRRSTPKFQQRQQDYNRQPDVILRKQAYKQSEKGRQNDKQYYENNKTKWTLRSKKMIAGKIPTKSVLELEKSLPLIKELYYNKNYDALSIAKHFKTSQSIVLAVLRRNNLSVKPKAFHNQACLECSNGLMVKSNSERRIVEFLLNMGVSFVYEKPIKYGKTTFFPDFYIPEKDVFVEFAGLMGIAWYEAQLEKKKLAMAELNKNYIIITKPEQIAEVLA